LVFVSKKSSIPARIELLNMFPAPQFLSLLILTSPVFLRFDGPIAYGAIAAATAILVSIVGLRARPGEIDFLSLLMRPIALVALVPVLLIFLQLIPARSVGLANPIWQSAATAVGRPVFGSISIDPGVTLISMARYLSVLGITFVAAALAIDRRRAIWLLMALTGTTALSAAAVVLTHFGVFAFLNGQDNALSSVAAIDSAFIGIILSIATALQAIEQPNSTTADRGAATPFHITFLGCLVAFAMCTMAVIISATSELLLALICGIATLVVTIVVRRFRFGLWGYSAILSVAMVAVVAAVALRPADRTMDLSLAFTSHPRAPAVALTDRILAESSLLGNGAGTFSDVVPIYRDIDEQATGIFAPTATAAIAVEMGKPFLWISVLAAIALIIFLVRGAVRRGRDASYSMAGASCVAVVTALAFNNAGVFNSSVLVVAAAAIGIAIAQSRSRAV